MIHRSDQSEPSCSGLRVVIPWRCYLILSRNHFRRFCSMRNAPTPFHGLKSRPNMSCTINNDILNFQVQVDANMRRRFLKSLPSLASLLELISPSERSIFIDLWRFSVALPNKASFAFSCSLYRYINAMPFLKDVIWTENGVLLDPLFLLVLATCAVVPIIFSNFKRHIQAPKCSNCWTTNTFFCYTCKCSNWESLRNLRQDPCCSLKLVDSPCFGLRLCKCHSTKLVSIRWPACQKMSVQVLNTLAEHLQ